MGVTRLRWERTAGGVATAWITESFDELIASWKVELRESCEVAVQARRDGRETGWYVLGRRIGAQWSSLPGQTDRDGHVEVDVLHAVASFDAYRLRVAGGVVSALAACTTLGPPGPVPPHGGRSGVEVPLEPLSQMAWRDSFLELGGGGAGWCSPACVAMVLGAWGPNDLSVPQVAHGVHDPAYGCGNWSANVAFVASLGFDAVVDRLDSLVEARPFLDAGVPLVASIAVEPGALPGFPLADGTAGHLVVLAGETDEGDPIVYDPAAPSAAEVRRIYPRVAFERAWLEGSRGTVYVIRPELDPPGPA